MAAACGFSTTGEGLLALVVALGLPVSVLGFLPPVDNFMMFYRRSRLILATESSLRSSSFGTGITIFLTSSGSAWRLNYLRVSIEALPSLTVESLVGEGAPVVPGPPDLVTLVSRLSMIPYYNESTLLSFSFRMRPSVWRNLMSRPNRLSFVGFNNSFFGS